jgi:hypothetical protein
MHSHGDCKSNIRLHSFSWHFYPFQSNR